MLRFLILFLSLVPLSVHSWTRYTFLEGLPSNQTRGIRQLPDGRMLVVMEGSFVVFDGAEFRAVPCRLGQTYPLASRTADTHFLDDRDGTWWLARMGRLYHFDPVRCSFLYDVEKRIGRVDAPLTNLWPDREGGLWYTTASGRLYRSGRLVTTLTPAQCRRGESIATVIDKAPYYLIYYSTDSLVALDRRTLRRRFAVGRVVLPEGQTTLSINNQMSAVSSVSLDDHRLALAANTRGSMIAIVDVKRRTVRQLPAEGYISAWSVTGQRLTVNAFDKVMTYDLRGGIVRRDTLPDKVLDLTRDRDGGLWLATLASGLYYQSPVPAMITTRRTPRPAAVLPYRDDMEEVHEVTPEATSTAHGLYLHGTLYNKENTEGLTGDNISFCLRLAPDSLLVCHSLTALGILRPSQRRFYPIAYRPLEAHYITSAVLDSKRHRVVLASQCGMYQLSLPGLRFSSFPLDSAYEDLGGKYNCQLLTSRGQWWLGTQKGLIVVGRGIVLEGECIQSLLESRDHRSIWVATSGSVLRFDAKTLTFERYDQRDGLLAAENCERAIEELADGRIAVGSMAGISYCPPAPPRGGGHIRLSLVGLTLCGEEVTADGLFRGRTLFTKGYMGLKGLTLRYDENYLTVRVSALRYFAPHRLHYRYRLEGSRQTWQEAESDDGRIACSYTALAPGRYTLRVECEGEAWALPITVRPPLWATWWARAIYIIVFIIVIVYCVRLYQQLRRRRMELLVRVRRMARRVASRGRWVRIKDAEVTSHDDDLLRRITASIEKHIEDPDYGVDALAIDVGIARTHLYRKMQQITGRTPSDFILALRLTRAAQLLKETDFTVAEVAFRTGFKTPRTFSTRFRTRYGVLPKDYKG